MKLGRIELVHNFEGEPTYIIIRLYKTSSPLTNVSMYVTGSNLGSQDATTVTQVVYPAPHQQESLVIEDLDPVMYDVKTYRSADGINIDEQITILACDAGARAQYSSTMFQYIVDRNNSGSDPNWSDPVSATIILRDERLLNGNYRVYVRGVGLRGTDEYTDRSDLGGGFDLTIADELWETGQRIFVILNNRVDVTGDSDPSATMSGDVTDVYVISSDKDFDPTMMNGKLLFVNYASIINGKLAIPSLATLPDCNFKVSTMAGLQRYFGLILDPGDTVATMNGDKNIVWLGKGEIVSIFVRNNVMYITSPLTGYEKLGQRIFGDRLQLNTVYRDGTQYNQDDYPRVMEFVEMLSVGNVVSETVWNTSIVNSDGETVYPNKGLFARDDLANTIRVPDSRNKFIRALKFLDATVDTERNINKPGGQQDDAFKIHNHIINTSNSPLSNSGDADPARSGNHGDVSVNRGGLGASKSIGQTGNTTETRAENEGLIPLLCI